MDSLTAAGLWRLRASLAVTGVVVLTATVVLFVRDQDTTPWSWLWLPAGAGAVVAAGAVALGLERAWRAGHHARGQRHDYESALRAVTDRLSGRSGVSFSVSTEAEDTTELAPRSIELLEELHHRHQDELRQLREQHQGGLDSITAVVVSLARAVQSTAHRVQEEAAMMVSRNPHDPDVLNTSMVVDHAAAQQARQAQTIAVLCGEAPGQLWHDLSLTDVIRGASSRITAYQRVEVSGDPGIAVVAHMVEPTIHLVAELLANATQSSPPTTMVLVTLRQVQRGVVIEIDDCGVGMDEPRLEQCNAIASGRQAVGLSDLGEVPQTGLAVVGTYARRHGLRVELSPSVYGGLRATVLLPAELTVTVAPVLTTSELTVPERAPLPERATTTPSPLVEEPAHGSLPRRRSRRHEKGRTPDPARSAASQQGDGALDQSPEDVGRFMSALFSTEDSGRNHGE